MSSRLTITGLTGVPMVQPGDDLAQIALDAYAATGLTPFCRKSTAKLGQMGLAKFA